MKLKKHATAEKSTSETHPGLLRLLAMDLRRAEAACDS